MYQPLLFYACACSLYRVVQKIFPPVWNSRLISAKQNGQPMHSQLAPTEHVSLNLAPLILLDPVYQTRRRGFRFSLILLHINLEPPHHYHHLWLFSNQIGSMECALASIHLNLRIGKRKSSTNFTRSRTNILTEAEPVLIKRKFSSVWFRNTQFT